MSKRNNEWVEDPKLLGKNFADTATLLPIIYAELKTLARAQMASERAGHTLQTTALVHETYLRLFGAGPATFENRAHFFAAAGKAMRRILVDWARAKKRKKRGDGAPHEPYDEMQFSAHPRPDELLEVDAALEKLLLRDPAMVEVIVQRYFVGLSIAETAVAMNQSERSVSRLWAAAKLWLTKELAHA